MNRIEIDELGIPVRLGLDPQMRMEAEMGGSEPAGGSEGGEPGTAEIAPSEAATSESTGESNEPVATDPAGADKWDEETRKYIEDLRNESAKHRTRASKYEKTFSDWPEEAVDGFLNLAGKIATNDPSAAPVLEQLLTQLTPKQQEELREAVADQQQQQEQEEQLLFKTQAELDAYLEQRDAAKREAAAKEEADAKALQALRTEITDLGFNVDTPNEDTNLLFYFASQQEGEGPKDFKVAAEKVNEYKQSLIDNYIQEVTGRKNRWPKVARNDGATPLESEGGKKALGISNGNSKRALVDYLNSVENN